MWQADLAREFETRSMSFGECDGQSYSATLYVLRMPCDGVQVFFRVHSVFAWLFPGEGPGQVCRKMHNALRWWTAALQKAQIPSSHLRRGTRTKCSISADFDPSRIFPSLSCSFEALMWFFSRTVVNRGAIDSLRFSLVTALLSRILAGQVLQWPVEVPGCSCELVVNDGVVSLAPLLRMQRSTDAAWRALGLGLGRVFPQREDLDSAINHDRRKSIMMGA